MNVQINLNGIESVEKRIEKIKKAISYIDTELICLRYECNQINFELTNGNKDENDTALEKYNESICEEKSLAQKLKSKLFP